jgi:hypothetical protein
MYKYFLPIGLLMSSLCAFSMDRKRADDNLSVILMKPAYTQEEKDYAVMEATRKHQWKELNAVLPDEEHYSEHLLQHGYSPNTIRAEITELESRNSKKMERWADEKKLDELYN